MPTVAIDVMSGDGGCLSPILASQTVVRESADTSIILVGQEEAIKRHIAVLPERIQIEAATEVVAMDDLPARAIRRRNTSMRRALELVAEGRADAAVSAGNTGALLGLGVLVLKMIDGINRPAIASFVPKNNARDTGCLLDLGANVECTPEMLCDFALMGTALMQAVRKIERPRVGLLNIGEEQFKGSKVLLRAAELLEENPFINYIGNVEGYDVYNGDVDVIVCDGFTGNVALKVSEGLALMINGMIKKAFDKNAMTRFCALPAYPILRKLAKQMDHRSYNGASFLGLRGIVVKSHGNADEKAFGAAIRYAVNSAEQDLPNIINNTSTTPATLLSAAVD